MDLQYILRRTLWRIAAKQGAISLGCMCWICIHVAGKGAVFDMLSRSRIRSKIMRITRCFELPEGRELEIFALRSRFRTLGTHTGYIHVFVHRSGAKLFAHFPFFSFEEPTAAAEAGCDTAAADFRIPNCRGAVTRRPRRLRSVVLFHFLVGEKSTVVRKIESGVLGLLLLLSTIFNF